MLQYGLPVGAVKHALRLDGSDPGIIDQDPTKSLSSQVAATAPRKQLQSSTSWKVRLAALVLCHFCHFLNLCVQEQDRCQKYHKMLRMGLPMSAVHHAMRRDGMDPSVLGIDLDKSADHQLRPVYDRNKVKYHKMRRMGLPIGAVHHAMRRDGMDPSLCIDFDKSVDRQLQLPDDEKIKKYHKMLRMGLPTDAVRNAMRRDGMDPSMFAIDVDKLLIKSCSP